MFYIKKIIRKLKSLLFLVDFGELRFLSKYIIFGFVIYLIIGLIGRFL